MEEVYKKDYKKETSTNPERQILGIFTSVSIMLAPQGDTKLKKILACPKNPEQGNAYMRTYTHK